MRATRDAGLCLSLMAKIYLCQGSGGASSRDSPSDSPMRSATTLTLFAFVAVGSAAFAPLSFSRSRTASPAMMSNNRPKGGMDTALDSIVSVCAAATFAVTAAAEAWTEATRQLDAKKIIDVSATETHKLSHSDLAIAGTRAHAVKVTVTKKGLKEKELLLSGPHSPLYRPRTKTGTLWPLPTGEDWGI